MPIYSKQNPNAEAWQLFIDNKPEKAHAIFTKNIKNKDASIAGEAYRGLSIIAEFTGDLSNLAPLLIKAYNADKNLVSLTANNTELLSWSRYGDGKKYKAIYSTLHKIEKGGGLFASQYQDHLVQKYLTDGNLTKAMSMNKKMGIFSEWKFIGPFDNISNSGFNKRYPPELEIDFTKEYEGKDGNKVRWRDLINKSPSGWIYLENHSTAYNAIHYLYCTVHSTKKQKAIVAFGSSSTFKIYLNGEIVLQDSVFKNTGIDVFMREVSIKKGKNTILLKLGHETESSSISLSGKANFLLRLLNLDYKALSSISVTTEPVNQTTKEKALSDDLPTPLLDSISAVMNRRLKKNPDDIDALVSLINLLNTSELTSQAQSLISKYLKHYPNSSFLYSKFFESCIRAKKHTESEIAIEKAYELCPKNYVAWQKKLTQKMGEGNAERLIAFLDNSYKRYRKGVFGLEAYLTAYLFQQKQSELLNCLSELEKIGEFKSSAISILYPFYINQGEMKKAINLLSNYLKYNRNSSTHYSILASLYLKQGNGSKAIHTYRDAIKFSPSDPDPYYYMSTINYTQKNYQQALNDINTCLKIIPNSHNSYNLKGNILATMGEKEKAIDIFNQAVEYTSDDFVAWESMRALSDKPSFESMTPLPDVDSIIEKSKQWLSTVSNKASVISYSEDIYYYPSHCTRSRNFFIIHLPNQKEIDEWKEYRVSLNSIYQTYNIDRALTRKSNGTQVQADVNKNLVVFKSLEPGDFIVLEYSLFDYYQGRMAGQVHGRYFFEFGYPTYSIQLRLITPDNDTIPYAVYGKAITVSSKKQDDYRITVFTAPPRVIKEEEERFMPTDYKDNPKVVYSTFSNWKEIAQWYYELTRHKQKSTIELRHVADSLFSSVQKAEEKVGQVHEYIASNITYSYIPFRQSGWVPQAAQDVLATRIGDCKDMASLGKSLLDLAGIESHLVLVNSNNRHFTDHAYIGPNFNHCILAYNINGKMQYVDFTDKNTALGSLPEDVQGVMALVVSPESGEIVTLPIDTPDKRFKERIVKIKISKDKSIEKSVKTTRTGSYAASFRESFRFITEEEKKKELKEALIETYPDVELKKFEITNLDTLSDTLTYVYEYSANDAVIISGKTAIFNVNLVDKLGPGEFPVNEKREMPFDLAYTWFDISNLKSKTEIIIPKGWRLLNFPENVKLKTGNGEYSLKFSRKGSTITIYRKAKFNYNRQYTPDVFKKEIKFLKKVSVADNVQLVFNQK